jgi:hypothetical protein
MALIEMKRIEPIRPGGPVSANVDESDVSEWRKAGWQVVEVEKPKNAKPDAKVDLDGMTVNELRTYAKENGVNIPAALKDRSKIVAALTLAIEGKSGPLA